MMKLKEMKEYLTWRVTRREVLIVGWLCKIVTKYAECIASFPDQVLIKLVNLGQDINDSGLLPEEDIKNDPKLHMALLYICFVTLGAQLVYTNNHSHDSWDDYVKYIDALRIFHSMFCSEN